MKLKILTILLILAYVFSFNTAIDDMKRGYNDGRESAASHKSFTYLKVKSTLNKSTSLLAENTSEKLVIKENQSVIRVENKANTTISFVTISIWLAFFLVIILLYALYIGILFIKNVYKGNIAVHIQIKRLSIVSYILLGYAVVQNIMNYLEYFEHQKIAQTYNLEVIKINFNFSIFFIPLILLMIVEVLKQHLKLKEESDLTI